MGEFKKLGELYNAEEINNMGYSGNEDCYVIGTNNEVIHPGASPLLKPIVTLDNNDTGKAEHYLVQYMNENLINLKPINEDGSFGEGSHSYDYDGFVKKFGQGSISAHQNIVIDPTINSPSADELMGTTQEPLTFQSTIEKHGIDEVTKYEVGNKILYTNNNTGALVNPTLDRVMEVKDGNGERHIILISSISENSIKFAEIPGDYGEDFLNLSKTSKDDEISYLLTSGLASSDLIGATLLGFGNNFEIKEMSADEFLTTYQFENYSDNSDNEEVIIPEEIEADLAPTEEDDEFDSSDVEIAYTPQEELSEENPLDYSPSEYRELTKAEICSNYSIIRITTDKEPDNYNEQVLYVPLIEINNSSLLSEFTSSYEEQKNKINKLYDEIISVLEYSGEPFNNKTQEAELSHGRDNVNNIYKTIIEKSEGDISALIKDYNQSLLYIKEGVKLKLLKEKASKLNGEEVPGTRKVDEIEYIDYEQSASTNISDEIYDGWYRKKKIKTKATPTLNNQTIYRSECIVAKVYAFEEKTTSKEMEELFTKANIQFPYHSDKIQLS